MAKHATKAPSSIRLTWDRLSSPDIWSLGLFWFAATVFVAATFLMDVLRTENYSWLWLVTYFASLALTVALVLASKFLVLARIRPSRVGLANILIAALIGGLKNLFVAILSDAMMLESVTDPWFRFVGGVTMGVAILAIYSSMTGARTANGEALAKLTAVRNDLLGSRENLGVLLNDELDQLQEKSREAVLPNIAKISKLLKEDTETGELVEAIRGVVSTQIKPLMNEISLSPPASFTFDSELPRRADKVSRPKSFVARDLIKPWTYLAYTLPGVAFETFFFEGLDGIIYGTIATFSFVAVMWLLKVFVFPKKATSSFVGYTMLSIAATVSPVFGLYIIGGALPLTAHESLLVPLVCWLIYICAVVVLSPVILLDLENQRLQEVIATENDALAREIAVFEQKVWVFKRRWLFMLHGTVQSALTAALTRLQTFADSDPYQIKLIQGDLERAEKALLSTPSAAIDFEHAVAELRESWIGVCAVSIEADLRASRALATNQGSAYCVNEILKEAIGNAVRHGGATAAVAKITREKDDFIDIQIQNDGSAPKKGWKKGIGSRMLDDITLNWSLTRSGRLTTLTARLPL